MEHVLSHWRRPELCRKWKFVLWDLKRNRKLLLWVCFHVFVWNLHSCLGSQAGQVWLSLLGRLQFVFCETWNGCSREDWDRCREGTLNPETGRYSEVVVILTELCVKITWMQVFPFWLRAIIPYCVSRDGWLIMEISASQSWLWNELYGLCSDGCQCYLPTLDLALALVEMEFTNKMLVVLFDPGGFPLRTLGHVGWTSCTTRRLAWSSTRFAALEICRIQGRPQLRLQKSYQFQVPKTNPKLTPCTCLSWSWQSFPFCSVDERGRVFPKPAIEALRGLAEATPRTQNVLAQGHSEAYGDSKLYNTIIEVPARLNLK